MYDKKHSFRENDSTMLIRHALANEFDDGNRIRTPLYQLNTDEWPSHGIDVERERLLQGLDALMQMKVAEQFRSPGKDTRLIHRPTTID
jgi:aryl carrier-like protein